MLAVKGSARAIMTDCIARWERGIPFDLNYICEELYKTEDPHRYILKASGGALTEYADRKGDTWQSGCQMINLSVKEAFLWAAGHMKPEAAAALFTDNMV